MAHGNFLNQFEIAQIMYLRPSRIEEAVTLIPRYALLLCKQWKQLMSW